MPKYKGEKNFFFFFYYYMYFYGKTEKVEQAKG